MTERGWQNVTVVEADACTFIPPGGRATVVTFSYSLSSAQHASCAVHRGHRALRAACHACSQRVLKQDSKLTGSANVMVLHMYTGLG